MTLDHDLQARPIYHHQRDSIDAHLTIVFAALAVSRWIEDQTGWSIRRFVRTAPPLPHHRNPGRQPHHHRRRPTPDYLRTAVAAITQGAH
jgi:hypothetical protein